MGGGAAGPTELGIEGLEASKLPNPLANGKREVPAEERAVDVLAIAGGDRVIRSGRNQPELEVEPGGLGQALERGERGAREPGFPSGDGGLGGTGTVGELGLGEAGLAAKVRNSGFRRYIHNDI